jgi:16S rRNA (guanine966-N2)-methyltransferase
MRIVGGTWRGRGLIAPEGVNVRPTTDRVREAIFNILDHSDPGLDGARVLDLFAGSGALGLEAASRGARAVLFVETDPDARGAIRTNIEVLGATGMTRIFKRDATTLGPMLPDKGGPFDLVFLDPPYGKGLGAAALDCARAGGWLADDVRIIYECGADETPDTGALKLEDMRRYGDTKVLFLRG